MTPRNIVGRLRALDMARGEIAFVHLGQLGFLVRIGGAVAGCDMFLSPMEGRLVPPQLAPEDAMKPLDQLAIGQMPEDSVPGKILKLLLWFVLPLLLLTLADRTWMWTKYIKKTRHQDNQTTNVTQQ